jgi:hypothetical protein
VKVINPPYLRLAIHQPNFIPRLKVLQKLANADVWCVLDSVQYCTREWQNRTQIVPVHGDSKPFWLSIPVHKPEGRNSLISEIIVENPDSFANLMEKTIFHAFHLSPHWTAIQDFVSTISPTIVTTNLTQLCVEITYALLNIANRKPILLFSSSLPVTGKASSLIASICKYLKCKTYLADSGSRNYMLAEDFKSINVLWQNWHEPSEKFVDIDSWRDIGCINYLSRFGRERFIKHILDAEFNINTEWNNHSLYSLSGDNNYEKK